MMKLFYIASCRDRLNPFPKIIRKFLAYGVPLVHPQLMNLLIGILLLFSSLAALGQEHLQKGLERLNFFPDTDAYFMARYEHQRLNIKTPPSSVDTKEVHNHANVFSLTYAHRFARKMFLGTNLIFEQTSENAISYGIPLSRRTNGIGFREPELFMTYRLREQKEEKGPLDLYLLVSPSLGNREVGKENAKRLNGRNIMKLWLSHGLWEEEWEFRTALGFDYYGKGLEENKYANQTFDFDSYYVLNFKFNGQYRISPWLFAFGGIGFNYKSLEIIREDVGTRREIQAGTGSLFEAGVRLPMGTWSLIELTYDIHRYEYFVKADAGNLDGNGTEQRLQLTYKMAF